MNVILLVEDRELDTRLVQQALASSPIDLHCVQNGEDCLRFLRKLDPYSLRPMPDLVLLDLSLPGMDGRDVLVEIRRDKALCHLPVVILTGAMEADDLLRQYQAGCSGYIIKPAGFSDTAQVIRAVIGYWFYTAVLPRKS